MELTIRELAAAAADAVQAADVRVTSGRVTDLPDERTIRWYATIGLLDRPSGSRGRTSLYGERHLLQLVAIKRRQSEGRTIAEIQTELVGATDRTLRRIADLPAAIKVPPAVSARREFWRGPPALSPPVLSGVPLGDGVVLMLPHRPDDSDVAAIRAVAQPLLEALTERHPDHEEGTMTTIERDDAGFGALWTEHGNLPLHRMEVRAAITGLSVRTELVQGFRNPHDVPLEATYIFPLPDRSAVLAMTLTAAGRTVVADLRERAAARQAYDDAIAAGQRAAIAEEDRPDVFTMRVGNIAPGESVDVALTTVGPLPYEDGAALFRFPLVVAPRYVPGQVLAGDSSGTGYASDTDAVPDASRITPPVLLPGVPNPVRLTIEVEVDPAGLTFGPPESSLHTVTHSTNLLRVEPGERVDRDFVLRLPCTPDAVATSLAVAHDAEGDEGTFALTVVPPVAAPTARAKDVILLLDRSGSMHGWKIVAARRAAARIVDTLGIADRFAVLAFDDVVERMPDSGLLTADDRNRYRAVERLARTDARGGTELTEALREGLATLPRDSARDQVLVLVTDGQVADEDRLLAEVGALLHGIRVHTVGVDEAVNAGLLRRLATMGGGRCELVESEDRLDDALTAIHRRISAPVLSGLRLAGDVLPGTLAPARLPDVFAGAPVVIRGRFRGAPPRLSLTGSADGRPWQAAPEPVHTAEPALGSVWARAMLRELEDGYAVTPNDALEQRIVGTSLRFGVLCRFTAFVAVDSRVTNSSGELHQVIQPVESPRGWEMAAAPAMPYAGAGVPLALAAELHDGSGRRVGWMSQPTAQPFKRRVVPAKRAARPRASWPAQLRAELATLADEFESTPGTDWERELADFARRLDDVADRLAHAGSDPAAVRALAALLRDRALDPGDRWARGRSMIARLLDERRPFWKRSPAR